MTTKILWSVFMWHGLHDLLSHRNRSFNFFVPVITKAGLTDTSPAFFWYETDYKIWYTNRWNYNSIVIVDIKERLSWAGASLAFFWSDQDLKICFCMMQLRWWHDCLTRFPEPASVKVMTTAYMFPLINQLVFPLGNQLMSTSYMFPLVNQLMCLLALQIITF